MSDYTHRDRRAHRDVERALWVVVGISLGLTGLALGVPLPIVGTTAVVALGVLGAVYIGWSDRILTSYADDLRGARDGSAINGFRRVEVVSTVGLDRDARPSTGPSPHTRRRARGVRAEDPDPPLPAGSEFDQG